MRGKNEIWCAPAPARKEAHIYDALMNAAAMLQLKKQLSQISDKERQEVSAFIHRLKQESPAWQKNRCPSAWLKWMPGKSVA